MSHSLNSTEFVSTTKSRESVCREKERKGREEKKRRRREAVWMSVEKKGKGKSGSPRLAGTFPPLPNSEFHCLCVRVDMSVGELVCEHFRWLLGAGTTEEVQIWWRLCAHEREGEINKGGKKSAYFMLTCLSQQHQTSTSPSDHSSTSAAGLSHWLTHTSPTSNQNTAKKRKKKREGLPCEI